MGYFQISAKPGKLEEDVRAGVPGVWMPEGMGRKYASAGQSLEWQWLFPAQGMLMDPGSGRKRRHYLNETVWQRAVTTAAGVPGSQ